MAHGGVTLYELARAVVADCENAYPQVVAWINQRAEPDT